MIFLSVVKRLTNSFTMISETDMNDDDLNDNSNIVQQDNQLLDERTYNMWKFPKFKSFLDSYHIISAREIYADSCKIGFEITSQVGPIEKTIVVFYNHPTNILSYNSINRYLNIMKDFIDIIINGPCWGKSKITKAIQLLEMKLKNITPTEKIEFELGERIRETSISNQGQSMVELRSQYMKKEKELRSIMEQMIEIKN